LEEHSGERHHNDHSAIEHDKSPSSGEMGLVLVENAKIHMTVPESVVKYLTA